MARTSLGLAVAAALWLGALPAAAVKPCHHLCHLGQGQPLLLADAGQVLAVTCTMPMPGDYNTRKCVLLRLGLDGNVLDEEDWSSAADDDQRLQRRLLARHVIVRLEHQSEWKDPRRTYDHKDLSGRRTGVSLRVERDELVLSRASSPRTERRALGCVPQTLSVRAAAGVGPDGKPEDPRGVLAVIASCPSGLGTREVATVFASTSP